MLQQYSKAYLPFVFAITTEFIRFEKTISLEFSNIQFKAFWDYERGFTIYSPSGIENKPIRSPLEVIKTIDSFPNKSQGGSVTILRNFDEFLKPTCTQHFQLQQMILNRKYEWRGSKNGQNQFRQVIMVSEKYPDFLPSSFDDIPRYRFPLLKRDEIKDVIEPIFKANKIKITPMIAEMAVGMRQLEIENAIGISLVTKGKLDPDVIMKYKIAKIRKFYEIEQNLPKSSIGGLKVAIKYLEQIQASLTDNGRRYGLPYPKLILVAGYPGCGKSLLARVAANILGIQLLRLDMGVIFGGILGESERNMREALSIADAMAPVLIWIDEIEKGMAGFENSGNTSGGVPERLLQTLLTWLNERETPVILYATSNDLSRLPAPLLRAGRTEDIFWVGLPNLIERREILIVQLKKYAKTHNGLGAILKSKEQIEQLAEATKDFSGSEIEKLIVKTMRAAYPKPVTMDNVLNTIPRIRTLAKTRPELLEKEQFAERIATNASEPMQADDNPIWSTRDIIIAGEGT